MKKLLAFVFVLCAMAFGPKLVRADWPGASDAMFVYDSQHAASQVTATRVTVSTSATTTIAANTNRVYWYAELISGSGCTDLRYDVGTVSVTASPYVLGTSTTSAVTASRRITVNVPGVNYQGPIELKGNGTTGCVIEHLEFTR